jgi:Mrp family chromosome partitioning ATPase
LLAVLHDYDILLRPDQKAAIKLITAIKSKMLVIVVNMLYLIQKAKIRAFGEKSFFYYKERYNLYKIPFSVIKPDLEVVSENNLYTPNIVFAKERIKSKIDDLSSKDK